jgi:kumamolisin
MKKKQILRGSEQLHDVNVKKIDALHNNETIEITIYLRRLESYYNLPNLEKLGTQTPEKRQHLTFKEFKEKNSANNDDIERVLSFAKEMRLHLIEIDTSRSVIKLLGTVADLNKAFGIELMYFKHLEKKWHSHTGSIHIPEELKNIVSVIMGLDNRPVVRTRNTGNTKTSRTSRTLKTSKTIKPGSIKQYTANQVAQIYNFPENAYGNGQTIGIIVPEGGYHDSDLDTYFNELGISKPKIISVGENRPGTISKPARGYGEVVMDIETVGAIIPDATIVVYFAKANTQKDFMEIIHEAIHDTINRPQVLSISWGSKETDWTANAAKKMEEIIHEGALMGVTICVASGNKGASYGLDNDKIVANFPSSVPGVLSCGGTQLIAKENNVIEKETVWNNIDNKLCSGGGISFHFSIPDYQKNSNVPPLPKNCAMGKPGFKGRGVPDVAGNADPLTGYRFFILNKWYIDGGTSVVAPLWAALIIKLNQLLGKPIGFVNHILYKLEVSSTLRDITEGNNGFYNAQKGWDACTGLGSPDGVSLLKKLFRNHDKDLFLSEKKNIQRKD